MHPNHPLSRRGLLAGSVALAAAAALDPNSGLSRTARAQGTPVPVPAAPERQVLRWGGPGPIRRLSIPGYSHFFFENFQNLYLTVLSQDTDGNIIPGLCLDYDLSADGLVYTFHLDPAARWSDGSKVTADDVKFSWEWLANPAVSGNPFPYYSTHYVVGHDAVFRGETADMAGLVVRDAETLDVTLRQPFTPFVNYVAQCLTGVHQKKEIVEGGEGWDLTPTQSCGPLVITEFNVDTGELVAEPNPSWWREPIALQRIEYRVAPDVNTLALLWSNDEVDIWELNHQVAVELLNGSDREFFVEARCLEANFLVLDTRKPPLDDIEVRRALLHATDVQTVVPAIFGTGAAGIVDPATGIQHPRTPGLEPRSPFFDPAAARAALAASSYGDAGSLPPIALAVGPANAYRRVIEAVQQGWQETLGIQPAILPTDPGFDPEELGSQVALGGNAALFFGPGCLLTWGWHADNTWMRTFVGVNDPEIEDLLNRGDGLPAEQFAERVAAYGQAEALILDRAYAIPISSSLHGYFVKPRVAGIRFNPSSTIDLATTYIAG